MDKKVTLVIVIVLILVGSFIFYEVNYNNHAKLGVAYFEIPEGFHEVNTPNIINLTNGTTSIFILEHSNNDIEKAITEYKNMKGDNYSININTFRVNDIEVSKSTIDNESKSIHYWFIKDGKLFEIYTWSGNSQTDSIVYGLISSLKFFIF